MQQERDSNQTPDLSGEAQNVNTDPSNAGELADNNKNAEQATNKAMEGIKQDKDSDRSQDNNMSGSR